MTQLIQPTCDLTSEDCLRQTVAAHSVVVFSKPWCPYCKRALETLAVEGVAAPLVINLAGPGVTFDGASVQATLAGMTGRRTVPNVFVGGSSIGGGDETVGLHRAGKLRGLLQAAGAVD